MKQTRVRGSEGVLNRVLKTPTRKNKTLAGDLALKRGCGMLSETECGNAARLWV